MTQPALAGVTDSILDGRSNPQPCGESGKAPRRRNRALATWRRNRAIELALEGRTYEAIAIEIGIANRGTVWRMVNKALDGTDHRSL
jgi:hypothetical protein